MAGLAVICKQRGMTVTGSDVPEEFITDATLAAHDIVRNNSFSSEHVGPEVELVVVGTSWGSDNLEIIAAHDRGLNVITDSELRGLLSKEKKTIAITGVHGKTTTTALLAHIFNYADAKPSFLVGTGTVPDLGGSAAWQDGEHFIVEGDEYSKSHDNPQPKFLDLSPTISIITSIEWEHVDIYPDVKTLESVFERLVQKTTGVVVACSDWPSVKAVVSSATCPVVTYGLSEDATWHVADIVVSAAGTTFTVKKEGIDLGRFTVSLYGRHNALNACAALIVAIHEGLKLGVVAEALACFKGTQRRFDVIDVGDVTFIDDYAHHPTEIKTTLDAVRSRFGSRPIWCVFQPHMASRTKALLNDFGQSFSIVDKVILTDIFHSAREHDTSITALDMAAAIRRYQPSVEYTGAIDETIEYLKKNLKPGMVLVTMGAGDVYHVRDSLIEGMSV